MALSTDPATPDDTPGADEFRPLQSQVRYQVLAFTVTLAAVTYLDRVCIAQTAGDMKRDLGLSDVQMGYVFSAFTLAYALFEMPSGAWGDRVGTRRVLTRIVAWWSTFTIATAAAFSYASLLAIRFLFGAGEAGCFPNVSRTFSRWFPVSERGRAQGIFFAGAHLGGGLTPLIVAALLKVMPWRMVFIAFGFLGFLWAFAWHRWFRDDPAAHPGVSLEELKTIQAGRKPQADRPLAWASLWRVVKDRNMILLCLMYFTQAYGFYFNITWLPTYLSRRGLSSDRIGLWAGVLAGLPLILSSLADLLGGLTTDGLTRARGLRVGRSVVGGLALAAAGVTLIAGATTESAIVSALLIAVSGACDSFLLASCWGVCQDIGGENAGLVSGCMNTAGQIGAVLSPVILPYFADPVVPLCIAGGLYLLGALCWLGIDPRRAIQVHDQDDDRGAAVVA